ncbi:hypothetical protein IW261DRAFT_1523606 [Armillaria novae-zelandiae]|uniref:Uncharacterized protein n=1 Tax=Armillaria novae-zelandiae TaxID=153914 RepID=A0AA39NHE2_9AGAR|nr:hypothetical protein IW261DRAFT_1523606 [Armillaria novae-zelandiae]
MVWCTEPNRACSLPTESILHIRDTHSTLIVAQVLFLDTEVTSKLIHVCIQSPGSRHGVTAGLTIHYIPSSQSILHIQHIKICTHGQPTLRRSQHGFFHTICGGKAQTPPYRMLAS